MLGEKERRNGDGRVRKGIVALCRRRNHHSARHVFDLFRLSYLLLLFLHLSLLFLDLFRLSQVEVDLFHHLIAESIAACMTQVMEGAKFGDTATL